MIFALPNQENVMFLHLFNLICPVDFYSFSPQVWEFLIKFMPKYLIFFFSVAFIIMM